RSPRSRRAAGKSRPRRCAMRRTRCTTSRTMAGTEPTAGSRDASRRALRARTSTGGRSAPSTMSMATAIWCARARRWRITRRRQNNIKKTGAGDVGNSTSSAPVCRHIKSKSLLRGRLAVGVGLALTGENLLGDQAGVLADRGLDLGGHVGVGLQEGFGVLAALAEALAVIGEPGAGLFDHAGLDAEVEDLAHLGDALAIHDFELDLLEGRRQLVLHHFDAGGVADHLVALLDGADAADVEADGGVKFQRVAAGGGFRRAVHHADLHADLVDEDHHGMGLVD